MLLPFVRVDGSDLNGFDGAARQVIAVESRPGRMPIAFPAIEERELSDGKRATLLSWLCADDEFEVVDISGDGNLISAFQSEGVIFAQFAEGGRFEDQTQLISHLDSGEIDQESDDSLDRPGSAR